MEFGEACKFVGAIMLRLSAINNQIRSIIVDITILIQSIIGLVAILGVLVILLTSPFRQKKVQQEKQKDNSPLIIKKNTGFQHLVEIVNNPESSTEELSDAMTLIIKKYGTIHAKLGMRPHPESKAYINVVFRSCRHKNINKDIIVKFSNALEKLNPTYKREIHEAMMRGLNSRGV